MPGTVSGMWLVRGNWVLVSSLDDSFSDGSVHAVQQVGAELMVSLDCVFTAGASLPRRLRCSLCAVL